VLNAASQQCGEEIAGYLRTLSTKVLAEMECTKRKRQFQYVRYDIAILLTAAGLNILRIWTAVECSGATYCTVGAFRPDGNMKVE